MKRLTRGYFADHSKDSLLSSVATCNNRIFTILQFVQTIRDTRVDLEDKISSLSILDNNPQKPVVRMANLCVVSSHTVSGPTVKIMLYCF